MKVLNKRVTVFSSVKNSLMAVLLASILSACGSADEDGMKAGLQKSGLNPEQATCYSGALKAVVKAGIFNDFATALMQGNSLKGTIKKMRLKHGEGLVDGMSKGKDKLEACLK